MTFTELDFAETLRACIAGRGCWLTVNFCAYLTVIDVVQRMLESKSIIITMNFIDSEEVNRFGDVTLSTTCTICILRYVSILSLYRRSLYRLSAFYTLDKRTLFLVRPTLD